MGQRSLVWRYFVKSVGKNADGQHTATCNICTQVLVMSGHSTSALSSHLKWKHPDIHKLYLESVKAKQYDIDTRAKKRDEVEAAAGLPKGRLN